MRRQLSITWQPRMDRNLIPLPQSRPPHPTRRTKNRHHQSRSGRTSANGLRSWEGERSQPSQWEIWSLIFVSMSSLTAEKRQSLFDARSLRISLKHVGSPTLAEDLNK